MTTESDETRLRFVETVVEVAARIEGIEGCAPLEGELAVALVLTPVAAVATTPGDDGDAAPAIEAPDEREPLRVDLAQLYEEVQALDPEAGPGRIAAFLAGMVSASQPLPPWEEAQTRVFLALRPLSFFHGIADADVVARRALPMLAECVVVDLGAAITYVTARLIEAWGVDVDVLFDVARSNVETRLEHDLGPDGDDVPPRIYRLGSGDSCESARLLSLSWLAKAAETLGAEGLVCAAPDRDTLLVAVDFAPPTLVRMAELAERIYVDSARRISPALYVFTPAGELGPLELVDDHPIAARVRRGHVMLADVEYAAQKALIDAELDGQEREVFLASYFAVERDGVALSYATWAQGVTALLPPVDLVAFTFVDEREPMLVPTEAVAAIVGERLQPVEGLEPPRVRTLGFPDEAQIEALREHAVEM